MKYIGSCCYKCFLFKSLGLLLFFSSASFLYAYTFSVLNLVKTLPVSSYHSFPTWTLSGNASFSIYLQILLFFHSISFSLLRFFPYSMLYAFIFIKMYSFLLKIAFIIVYCELLQIYVFAYFSVSRELNIYFLTYLIVSYSSELTNSELCLATVFKKKKNLICMYCYIKWYIHLGGIKISVFVFSHVFFFS